jgi:L,D-peptidoglycan transpeptidase YkuD (ErfK/YbiS/YcfS/YnhG family)
LRIPVRRRAFLGLAAQLTVAGVVKAAAVDEQLEYHGGCLSWPGSTVRAAIGRAGVVANKKEGDGATPAGTFPLISAFYRADRMRPPFSRLPIRVLSPNDAWVDDPTDRNYNRLVTLPYLAHAEPMWLDDAVYNLVVVIGYNMTPVVPGAGSAIFLHIARPDFSPTDGCIAVAREILVGLMSRLGPGSTITIAN